MSRKGIYYNRTNTCDRCREEGRETKLIPKYTRREHNKEGNWTGRWICHRCHCKDYYYTIGKYDTNSHNNIKKSLRDHRTGNLDPNSATAKGDKFQKLTKIWRSTISTIPVEDLNEKLDNYHSPIDHSIDSELGIIQTRGKLYDPYNQFWITGGLDRDWNKEYDYMIFYCASKDGNIIERIYIIPSKKEIKDKRKSIGIYRNPSKGVQWYEQYRIKDEKILEQVNEIYQTLI